MKKIVIVLLALLGMNSCIPPLKYGTEMKRSYISGYVDYDKLVVSFTEITGRGGNPESGNKIFFDATDTNYMYIYYWDDFYKKADCYSTGRDKDIYDSICIAHNDMTYNKLGETTEHADGNFYLSGDYVRADSPDWESISITSDKAFDSEHPAGSSLNDLVMFYSYSLYPFIQSGYDESIYPHNRHLTPIEKLVSELTLDDMKLLEYHFMKAKMEFTKEPEEKGKHTITATIRQLDGRVFTSYLVKNFR